MGYGWLLWEVSGIDYQTPAHLVKVRMSWVRSYRKGKDVELITTSRYFILLISADSLQ